MIDYLEQMLGIAEGSLHSDLGIMICSVVILVCFYAIVKTILTWLGTLFGKK